MSTETLTYPFSSPSYIAALDDGQLAEKELKESSPSWRSEGYAKESNVLVLDHNHGHGSFQHCNDETLRQLIRSSDQPQIRFILLEPTVHEKIASTVHEDEAAAGVLKANELHKQGTVELEDIALNNTAPKEVPDLLNISRSTLLDILTAYDLAPAACTHVRGQEQIFGSRVSRDEAGAPTAFEFWYAIRARAYVRDVDKEADLKITIITRYDVVQQKSLILLKYRSFNDLPDNLKEELVSKLKGFIMQKSTASIAGNPFALSLLHFNSTVQWYRRAARDPRDSVRKEEDKAHEVQTDLDSINIRRLHLTMRSLDQDKVQLNFILGVIERLRKQHDLFYRLVQKTPSVDDRDWLYLRVEEELDRLENQINYFRSSIEDVAARAQRLLDLLFNLSARHNALWNEKMGKRAMYESASMKAIAVVSMLFLPATLVTGVLGTNLFSQPSVASDDDAPNLSLGVSSQVWVLPVAAGALTLVTFTTWFVWKTMVEKTIEQKWVDEESFAAGVSKERRKEGKLKESSTMATLKRLVAHQ